MAIELKVPTVGESVTEVMIGEWLKQEGDFVEEDEPVVVIETDKVNVELPAPESGILKKIVKPDGEDAEVGDVVGLLEPADAPEDGGDDEKQPKKGKKTGDKGDKKPEEDEPDKDEPDKDEPDKDEPDKDEPDKDEPEEDDGGDDADEPRVMPAARRLLDEHGLEASDVKATGPGGRLLKEDVQRHLDGAEPEEGEGPEKPAVPSAAPVPEPGDDKPRSAGARTEEAVRLTPLRRRVATRLVEAQQTAALLTTFNEIDMSAVIGLRKQYQETFVDQHGVKLGFMSFFVKAAVEALKAVPRVNAEMREDEVVYRNYYDIGVAVGGGKGLVVPIIRNAERLSFAEVEKTIADLAGRARDGKLKLEELQGGTFTLSNGGIYGSLLSTPIVNPPQSGILGMHKIEDRPVAVDGEVVVRPMMYVALTYDHRIIDGREAVTFLVKIKEAIEDPTRILLEI